MTDVISVLGNFITEAFVYEIQLAHPKYQAHAAIIQAGGIRSKATFTTAEMMAS